LRGAGGTFCAGGDIKGFMASLETPPPAPGERDAIAVRNRGFGAFLARFDALPQTVVMVIEGAALRRSAMSRSPWPIRALPCRRPGSASRRRRSRLLLPRASAFPKRAVSR